MRFLPGMKGTARGSLLLFMALTASWSSPVLARQDIREMLSKKLAYDDVIRLAEDQISKGKGDKKELLAFEGYAYYLKGRLLLSAFSAGADLSGLYYECKEIGVSKGEYFLYVQGLTSAARGKLSDANRQLTAFRKTSKDKPTSDLAAVWIGCLEEQSGKPAERDKAWKGIDWKNYANASERQAAAAFLGIAGSPGVTRPATITDPVQARNALLTPGALRELSRDEKIRLVKAMQTDKPMFSSKGKSAKKEVYFDPLSLLAAGKASLSVGENLFGELDRMLTAEEKAGKKFAQMRNLQGQCAFLSGDMERAIGVLEGDGGPTSPAYLGAAYYRSGNVAKAEEIWKGSERSTDVRVASELGFVYALLGIKLEKAEELAGKFLAAAEDAQNPDQSLFHHYAFVKQKQGDPARAKEAYNQGYNYMRRGVLEYGANDPEYTIAFCAAIQRVDRTGMYDINDMLYKVREKYDFGVQLHEAATGLATCLEIKLGK